MLYESFRADSNSDGGYDLQVVRELKACGFHAEQKGIPPEKRPVVCGYDRVEARDYP
jgi:hypothetical protein